MIAVLGAAAIGGAWAGPGLRSVYAALFAQPEFVVGDFGEIQKETGKSVVIFTTSTCPYCAQARELLQSEGVGFHDFVLDQSPEAVAKLRDLGFAESGVPLLLIGDRKILGYRDAEIRAALKRL